MIIYVKNTTKENIPRLTEEGEWDEHPPCFDGQYTYEFTAGEVKALPSPHANIIIKNFYPRLQEVQRAGKEAQQEASFTVGTDVGLDNYGAGHDRPGKKTKKG